MSDNVFWYVVWIEFSTTMTSSHTFLWPKQKNAMTSLPPPAKNDVSTASKNNLLWLSCKKTPSCPGNFNRTWWGSSEIRKQNVNKKHEAKMGSSKQRVRPKIKTTRTQSLYIIFCICFGDVCHMFHGSHSTSTVSIQGILVRPGLDYQ